MAGESTDEPKESLAGRSPPRGSSSVSRLPFLHSSGRRRGSTEMVDSYPIHGAQLTYFADPLF
jgi:hypothetical protein